jgi:hypothetical protein
MIDLSRAGAVAQPDGEGRAGGGRCNDRVRFTLGLVGDRLEQVRFGADACASTTAAAAWLARISSRSCKACSIVDFRLCSQRPGALAWLLGKARVPGGNAIV